MRCLGRTETDRKITNEPWSSKQSLTEQRRPLFGVKGVVRPKKEKREQKFIKKVLTRAGIVRDVAYNESHRNSRSPIVRSCTENFGEHTRDFLSQQQPRKTAIPQYEPSTTVVSFHPCPKS